MTGANRNLIAELADSGLDAREARWLVEEFALAMTTMITRRCVQPPNVAVTESQSNTSSATWPFRSLDLDVDPRVLIPRPESEELVGVAIDELATRNVRAPLIVDLGCGSGAIGLALLSELNQRGVAGTLIAVDESRDALKWPPERPQT